jgi:hypothetical protein
MKPSDIKVDDIYRCINGTYRRVVFFWSPKHGYKPTDLAYVKLVRERKTGRFIRKTWVDGNCTIKHFARWSTRRV